MRIYPKYKGEVVSYKFIKGSLFQYDVEVQISYWLQKVELSFVFS